MASTYTNRQCRYQGRRRTRKKNLNKIDRYVIFSITLLIVYTIIELILATVTSIEHSTLTTCFFACFGGEILSCCLIKIFKLKGESNDDSELYNEERLLQTEQTPYT